MEFKPLLLGILCAATVTGVIALAGVRAARQASSAAGRGRWSVPLALGAGYAAGFAVLVGWPTLPPRESAGWTLYFLIAATGLGCLEAVWRIPRWPNWVLRTLSGASLLWLMLTPMRRYEWEGWEVWCWLGALCVALLAAWASLERLTGRLSAASLWPALMVVAAGTSVALLCSGYLKFALLGGILLTTLGACGALGLEARSRPIGGGAATVVTVILAGLWLGGYFFGEMPAATAILLVCAPSALWIAELLGLRRDHAWKTGLLRSLIVAMPVTVACLIALYYYAKEDSGY